jgi:hypothetical protein
MKLNSKSKFKLALLASFQLFALVLSLCIFEIALEEYNSIFIRIPKESVMAVFIGLPIALLLAIDKFSSYSLDFITGEVMTVRGTLSWKSRIGLLGIDSNGKQHIFVFMNLKDALNKELTANKLIELTSTRHSKRIIGYKIM